MKLHADTIIAPDGGDHGATMAGRRQHIVSVKGIAVQKVGLACRDQRVWGCWDDIVPAHMRNFDRRVGGFNQAHSAFDPAEPCVTAMFFACLGHQLHADANAQKGLGAGAGRFIQGVDHAGNGGQRTHAMGERADAGQDDPVGARHHIGVGLTHPINVHIKGSAGYFCGGLTDGPRFLVDNNVGWGVGDNMLNGSIVVNGNASAIPGVAIRGAEIVVKGNIGSRAGQVMKAGTLLACGNASFMAGYMMYGGRLVILGNSGEKVGQDMTGGDIYVAGKIGEMGTDAMLIDLPAKERDEILAFFRMRLVEEHGGVGTWAPGDVPRR